MDNLNLFESDSSNLELTKDTYLLRGFSFFNDKVLMEDLQAIVSQAPLRQMMTKMGYKMSVSMTNCGKYGWISDHQGYRYHAVDPLTKQCWPPMPESFNHLAFSAAKQAGFNDFQPDACLINQYSEGASMGLHQDKNELDFTQPIVSVSLGLPAVFQFGGLNRKNKPIKILLKHGDVLVWGGASRLNYHGIMPIKPGFHHLLGKFRFNLTFRKAK